MKFDTLVNILLVGNESADLLVLEAMLAELNEVFIRTTSDERALQKVLDIDFAVILLDARIPAANGAETVNQIRSRLRSQATPIIFVSLCEEVNLGIEDAYTLGAADYLTGPVIPAVLKAKVTAFVNLQRNTEGSFRIEREKQTAALDAKDERIRLILDNTKDYAFVGTDPDGRITEWEGGANAITGWHLEEAVGMPVAILFTPEDQAAGIPTAELNRARESGRAEDKRWHIRKNGTRFFADGVMIPLRDHSERLCGYAKIFRDATAEQQVAEANAKFRTFFEQGSYFAGVMSLDGTLIEANRLCLDACGFVREDVIGKKFWDCGWWNRSTALMEMIRIATEEAAAGRQFRRETPYFIADGSVRFVDLVLVPVTDNEGKVLFIAPTGTDVTDRKRIEDDLRRLAADLSEANRRKTEFLATLAHELRNPLAPIRNGLAVIRLAAHDAAAVSRTRAMMERQVGQMVLLINDLLDIARISSGKVDLRKKRVTLKSVISTAVETSSPLIEQGRHELKIQLFDESFQLDVDPTRIAQVISNLLNNAAKYTPTGGRIELTTLRQAGEVVISIVDNGVGIPAESLPHVFKMFNQVGRNMDHAQGGLGIGLTLVRRLVELHGGTVTATSPGAGKGSTFVIRLPLPERPALEAHTSKDSTTGANEAAVKGFHILIVDDNADAAESLSALLEIGGHTTRVAENGFQALKIAPQFQPQVVFLDIGMPGMNGYEVARAMRKTPGMERTMLVALTGWGGEEDRARAREAGFDQHLTKPVWLEAVEDLLAKHAALLDAKD